MVVAPADDRRAPPPPPSAQYVDMYPDSDDSDSDRDHPLQEPEFVLHADDADFDRDHPLRGLELLLHAMDRHRQPPAAPDLLPVHYPLAGGGDARTRRLCDWMIMPQAILCSCILVSGGFSIYFALQQPDKRPGTSFIWLIVYCVVIMVSVLLSLLLSYLGIYVYDDCM
ncbi:hypothetical protein ACP4OV_012168 [Aristida adscensionis]